MTYKLKYLANSKQNHAILECFANFHKSGSIKGMKKLFYGKNALLVRCGDYIYNVTENIYNLSFDSYQKR